VVIIAERVTFKTMVQLFVLLKDMFALQVDLPEQLVRQVRLQLTVLIALRAVRINSVPQEYQKLDARQVTPQLAVLAFALTQLQAKLRQQLVLLKLMPLLVSGLLLDRLLLLTVQQVHHALRV